MNRRVFCEQSMNAIYAYVSYAALIAINSNYLCYTLQLIEIDMLQAALSY